MAKARKRRKTAKRRVSPIPAGYHAITPYLTVSDGAAALAFYTRAFGARVTERMPGAGGKLMHAEFTIGGSHVMLSDEMPGGKCKSAASLGGTTSMLFVYVPNVDAAFKRAVDAGCRVQMPVTDMFWGDRYGALQDPFGNQWGLATHKEDVSKKEMQRRQQAFLASMAGGTS